MALSLASMLVPFLERGSPHVAITGRFALGQVKRTNGSEVTYPLGAWLNVAGLAVASSGHAFSLKVSGRPLLPTEREYVWDGQTIADYSVSNLTEVGMASPGASYPSYVDMLGAVKMANSFVMPSTSQYERSTDAGLTNLPQLCPSQPVASHDFYPELWTSIPGLYRIELRGSLASLDLRVLAATAFVRPDGGDVRPTISDATPVDTDSSYMARYTGYYVTDSSLLVDGTWMGWRTDSVLVVNQPQLRDHVLGANLAEQGVVWD